MGNLYFFANFDNNGRELYKLDFIAEIDNNNLTEEIKIYPNPANKFFQIENSIANAEINFISLEGKVLMSKIISIDKPSIDITSLAKGMYIIEVKNKEVIKRVRMVKA